MTKIQIALALYSDKILNKNSSVIFCRVDLDLCSSTRMVATFMPMYYVAMNFYPVPNNVALNLITYIT